MKLRSAPANVNTLLGLFYFLTQLSQAPVESMRNLYHS